MNEVNEDPLARLEALLLDWELVSSESRQRVTSRLQHAKTRLELAWSNASEVKAAAERVEVQTLTTTLAPEFEAEYARLGEAFEEAKERVASLEKSLDRAYARVKDLEHDRTEFMLRADAMKQDRGNLVAANQALSARIEELTRELEELRNERAASSIAAHAGAPDVDPLFTGVSQFDSGRVETIDPPGLQDEIVRMQADHDRANGVLASRLAEALRDRDEAHQQIVQLRAEIETLRTLTAAANLVDDAGRGLSSVDVVEPGLPRLRLGQMLQRAGAVNDVQLNEALAAKRKMPQKPLGVILVEMGFTDEATIGKVLASQLNLPYVELDQRAIDPAAAALIPAKLARHHLCIPLAVERGQLLVAMANPLDLVALEDLELATRRRVDPVIATPEAVAAAIAQHYTSI